MSAVTLVLCHWKKLEHLGWNLSYTELLDLCVLQGLSSNVLSDSDPGFICYRASVIYMFSHATGFCLFNSRTFVEAQTKLTNVLPWWHKGGWTGHLLVQQWQLEVMLCHRCVDVAVLEAICSTVLTPGISGWGFLAALKVDVHEPN